MVNSYPSCLKGAVVLKGEHSLKLQKKNCKGALRQYFSFRVVNTWNALPEKMVNTLSLNSFKANFDHLWAFDIIFVLFIEQSHVTIVRGQIHVILSSSPKMSCDKTDSLSNQAMDLFHWSEMNSLSWHKLSWRTINQCCC